MNMNKTQVGAQTVNGKRKKPNTRMPVTINPGLFPSERTIQFKNADGEEIAIFVSTGQVDEGENTVMVVVLEQNQQYALVQVPAQGGTTVAKVLKQGIRSS
jgi:O-glycosyl hydrolase